MTPIGIQDSGRDGSSRTAANQPRGGSTSRTRSMSPWATADHGDRPAGSPHQTGSAARPIPDGRLAVDVLASRDRCLGEAGGSPRVGAASRQSASLRTSMSWVMAWSRCASRPFNLVISALRRLIWPSHGSGGVAGLAEGGEFGFRTLRAGGVGPVAVEGGAVDSGFAGEGIDVAFASGWEVAAEDPVHGGPDGALAAGGRARPERRSRRWRTVTRPGRDRRETARSPGQLPRA
jgi:hypothetical protein